MNINQNSRFQTIDAANLNDGAQRAETSKGSGSIFARIGRFILRPFNKSGAQKAPSVPKSREPKIELTGRKSNKASQTAHGESRLSSSMCSRKTEAPPRSLAATARLATAKPSAPTAGGISPDTIILSRGAKPPATAATTATAKPAAPAPGESLPVDQRIEHYQNEAKKAIEAGKSELAFECLQKAQEEWKTTDGQKAWNDLGPNGRVEDLQGMADLYIKIDTQASKEEAAKLIDDAGAQFSGEAGLQAYRDMPMGAKTSFHRDQAKLYRQVGDEPGAKFHQRAFFALRSPAPAKPPAATAKPSAPTAAAAPAKPAAAPAAARLNQEQISAKAGQLRQLAFNGSTNLKVEIKKVLQGTSPEDLQKIMETKGSMLPMLLNFFDSDKPEVFEAMVNVLKEINPEAAKVILSQAMDWAKKNDDADTAAFLENALKTA